MEPNLELLREIRRDGPSPPSHLAVARYLAGHSQRSLGEATGLGRTTVVRVEQGGTPSLGTAAAIARALGVGVSDLFPL